MIQKLSLGEIVHLFANTPEQSVFDWKRTFAPPRDEVAKGEFVKDVMAVANRTAFTRAPGYVLYGVNPDAPDPFVGVTRWDDNEAQALVRSALRPIPEFLYYEVDAGAGRWVGVTHVQPRGGFYVVSRDLGKLREGQSLIRQGSTTRGVTQADQLRLYLTPGYGYAEQLLREYGAAAAHMNAQTARLEANQAAQQALLRQMEALTGLPRGSLG